jgi:uncharacterized protein YlzI (FlbEa/FlbD family)
MDGRLVVTSNKIFVQINQSNQPGRITYINVHQIENVSEQPGGKLRVQMLSGRTYIINEPIHTFLERI